MAKNDVEKGGNTRVIDGKELVGDEIKKYRESKKAEAEKAEAE